MFLYPCNAIQLIDYLIFIEMIQFKTMLHLIFSFGELMCFFFYETENEYPFGTRNTTDGKIN